jgi:hypothetical protein
MSIFTHNAARGSKRFGRWAVADDVWFRKMFDGRGSKQELSDAPPFEVKIFGKTEHEGIHRKRRCAYENRGEKSE